MVILTQGWLIELVKMCKFKYVKVFYLKPVLMLKAVFNENFAQIFELYVILLKYSSENK